MFMQTNETISQFLQGIYFKMEGERCRNENSGWGSGKGRWRYCFAGVLVATVFGQSMGLKSRICGIRSRGSDWR